MASIIARIFHLYETYIKNRPRFFRVSVVNSTLMYCIPRRHASSLHFSKKNVIVFIKRYIMCFQKRVQLGEDKYIAHVLTTNDCLHIL